MKHGTHAFALAVVALSTVSLAAPTAPAPTAVPGPTAKPGAIVKGKSITIRCPANADDGSGLPALTITAVDVPVGWRLGTSTVIRLQSVTVANGRFTCAYGGDGPPAVRTTKEIPAGYTGCTVAPDKTVTCFY